MELDEQAIRKLEEDRNEPGNKVKANISQWSEEGKTTSWGGLVFMLQSIEGAPNTIFQKLAKNRFNNKYKRSGLSC